MTREKTTYIIWHHSATKPDMLIGASDIDLWHKARGFRGVGYHKVICRDGTVEQGRKDGEQGAHCKGYNDRSFGVCIVGGLGDDGEPELNFTEAQYRAIRTEAARLSGLYPDAEHVGHRDLAATICPGFDVRLYLEKRTTGSKQVILDALESCELVSSRWAEDKGISKWNFVNLISTMRKEGTQISSIRRGLSESIYFMEAKASEFITAYVANK